jgi:hypothetical protein
MATETTNAGGRQAPAGGPEAGMGRASGNGEGSQPDRAGQPKGNPRPEQSNDNLTLPAWARQLPKKLASDPESAAKLSGFKRLEETKQKYNYADKNLVDAEKPPHPPHGRETLRASEENGRVYLKIIIKSLRLFLK